MASADIDYSRDIKKYTKLVARNKWQNKYLPSWWPGVKKKPIIISEGDSWFDFPLKSLTDVLGVLLRYGIGLQNFGMDSKTNIMDYVSRDNKLDGLFLRLERSGDTAPELSAKKPNKKGGVAEDKFPSTTLYEALQDRTIQKHLDCILLSAGGNDLVEAARKGVILDYQGTCAGSYEKTKLKDAAQDIVGHFLDALIYRDQFAPTAKVVCHSYAYPIQLSRGTTTEFDFKDASKLIELLLKFLNIGWIKKPLAAIGIDVDDLGSHTMVSDARLHLSLDDKGWPKNEGILVHPERQAFIKIMINALYDEMQDLPTRYQQKTGKPLTNFEYLDIREMCQDPKYWADFIHLNTKGYKEVGKVFVDKIKAIL